ncbi:MAG: type II toxin-antitoxin system prevent-host-death family antitoxin [Coriobacteriales bacterium]|jgi:prevent-host-death family protein|nr:type II toxin-antitoxin system prevent-host-death family antitoxin [Coriobacteriales bacterium]
MIQVNMHDAKTHLSELVEQAVAGEPFVIAKAGKPQVVVYAYQALQHPQRRMGFMPDLQIPEDFDTVMSDEIAEMFNGVLL